MKKLYFLSLLTTSLLFIACSDKQGDAKDGNSIDLAKAMNELTELKASDFGKSIQYIPLETTDESLIGNAPQIMIIKDKIIVITDKQCMAFHKDSGKFITKIGHIGDDPEAYSNTHCWGDEENGLLYFLRQPNQLIAYNTSGEYKGKIDIQIQAMMPSYFVFSGSSIVGALNNELLTGENSIVIYNYNGEPIDSVPNTLTDLGNIMDNITGMSVIRSSMIYGNYSKNGVIDISYSNDKVLKTSLGNEVLWKYDNDIYYKELFMDTIYKLKDNNLEKHMIFNTGSWYWPENERTNAENSNRRLIISYVNETKNDVFFQCIQGFYGDVIVYNGLFNKKTRVTKLAKYSDMIKDDITNFLPFQIYTTSAENEYASIIEAPDAIEWLEDNPDAEKTKELSFLNNLTDDMNPIVVVIK